MDKPKEPPKPLKVEWELVTEVKGPILAGAWLPKMAD